MQSALWKIITAVGIVGIGTLVVLEVQHRLPPLQAGGGLTATAPRDKHDHAHLPGKENDRDAPFYEAADQNNQNNPVEPAAQSDTEKTDNVKTGNGNPVAQAARLANQPGQFPAAKFSADAIPTAQSAASPATAASVDTTVQRNQLTDTADPFAPANPATAKTLDRNGVKVASFQPPESFLGDTPFSGDSSQGNTNPPNTSPDASPDSTPSFPALDTPAGASDANPFGVPFTIDPADPANSANPDLRNQDPANPAPFTSDPANPETFRPDPVSLDPDPTITNPATTDPFESDLGAPTTTSPADRTSDPEFPESTRPRSSTPRNELPEDRPLEERPANDTAIDTPVRRGSSIMFFGNDAGSKPNNGDVRDNRSSDPKFPDLRPIPDSSDRAGNRNPDRDSVQDREPALPFPSSNSARPDEKTDDAEPFTADPVRPAEEIDRRNDTRPDDLRSGTSRPGSSQPNSSRPVTPRPDPGRDLSVPSGSSNRDSNSNGDMFEPDAILPPTDSGDPDHDNGTGSAEGSEPAPSSQIMRPHLTLRKDAPQTASVGVPLEYRILVSNEGKSAAYDVIVEDELPRSADMGTQTPPATEFDQAEQKMIWKFDLLQPGESKEILVRVIPRGEGTLGGIATVRFKAQVKATTMVTAPKLTLEMTGPDEARSGDELNYRYVVRNEGTGVANEVILRTVLPDGLKHAEGEDLEYEIDTLKPAEEREIVLTVLANKPGDYKYTAEVTSSAESMAQRELDVKIIGAQLKVERLGPERRYVGRPAEFQNIITNETRFEATNIIIRESVPDGMKFVSAKGGEYDPRNRLITWEIASIAPEKQVLLDVELIPEAAGDQETQVEVQENAGFRSNVMKIVAVEDLHNVSADISRLDGAVEVGEEFKFSITIENRGTAAATGVQLVVQVPEEIKILKGGSKEENIEARLKPGNQVVYDPIARIEPKQKKVFHLVLQGQDQVKNGLVEGQVMYEGMKKPLRVSESVTVFSDSP